MISSRNKKAFTMIELLGAIVILGILSVIAIASATRLIDKSKKEEASQQASTLKQAAESYLQANSNVKPKSIGESVNVYASTLKEKKYLKENIKNASGEDCMEKTFVKVYKSTKSKYVYTPIILCGDEKYEEEDAPNPIIEYYFSDSTGNKVSADPSVLRHVKDAVLYIEILGGKDKFNNDIELDGYSYAVSVKTAETGNQMHEVFNSGTLSAGNQVKVVVNRKISDYLDITNISDFNVKIVARNKAGGVAEVTTNASQAAYHDTDKPICVDIDGQAAENEWINKTNGGDSRLISVGCEDAKGSGCTKPRFSKTWPNDQQEAAEWAYIQVEDNAGNKNLEGDYIEANSLCGISAVADSCRVRVNVDKVSPTIQVLGAYKATASGTKPTDATNTYTGHLTVDNNTPNTTGTIESNEYNNLVGGWMNNANYEKGVVYEITISDNIHLASWKWETNKSYLNDTASATLRSTYNKDNDGSKRETIESPTTGNCGVLTKTIVIGFNDEGERQGKLTVYDKAGNYTSLIIKANIDRTPPPKPTGITYSNNYNPDATGANAWSKAEITVRVPEDLERDNTSGPDKVDLSKWDKFTYHITKDYDTSHPITGDDGKFVFGQNYQGVNYQGKNNIEFKSCDKAGNCSAYSGLKKVWVDFTKPTCNVTVTATGKNSAGWLGIGEKAIIKATCQETASAKESGCENTDAWPSTFSKTYNSNINVTNAGAVDVDKGGKVRDIAKNERDCSKQNEVKIDHDAPTCLTDGETKKDSNGNWKWRKTGTIITRECRDTGGSGCKQKVYKSKAYETNGKTYKTEDYPAYTISDKADNEVVCPAKTVHIYVDKQAPDCSGSKSHQNTTDGVTIKYTCSDNGGSGVVKCPDKQENKKSDQSHTVKDNVGNSMTCKVNVTAYNQYRYIKKNVAATCTKGCCGYITKTSGTCCGWNTHTGQNCRNCGKQCYWKNVCVDVTYYTGSCKKWVAKMYCDKCKTCTWNTSAKRCANACTGAKTCTSASCCGYICGSQWTSWGASSTGCKSQSRKLYK